MKSVILIFLQLTLSLAVKAEEIKVIEGLKLEAVADDNKITLPKSPYSQALIIDSLSAIIVTENKLRFFSFTAKDFLDSKPLDLPADCTHLTLVSDVARSQRTLYCYGDGKKNDSIRQYKSGKFETVIKTPNKISAVTGDSNRIFFTSKDALFQVRAQEGVKAVFASSFLTGVISMAFDSKHDLIFLATKNQIFSLRGGVLDVLAEGFGGQLALVGDELLVVDSTNNVKVLKGVKELLVREK